MSLSSDLISEFVKVTKDDEKPKSETIVYGTTVEYNGSTYVKLDGSELLTPVSTTSDTKPGERVTVMIKDHTATITGNMSSPSARSGDVKDLVDQISEFEIVIADKVDAGELNAEKARIDNLVAENATVKDRLTATEADIGTLQGDNVTITGKLDAAEANIENLDATKISAEIADAKYATIENLEATDAKFNNLDSTYAKIVDLEAQEARITDLDAKKLSAEQADLKYADIGSLNAAKADISSLKADQADFKNVTADNFTAVNASIDDLEATKLSAESADLKYADIDFTNINQAAVEKIFSESGIIKDLIVSEGRITGELVGVTIKGDIIEGGTVKADKLVIKGSDGLFYKLNTDGVATTAEQTEYNSLSGTVITAKSITAEKVAVNDLVAFGATIGGFHITDSSIYSGVKTEPTNTTTGVYFDKDGQMAVGDATNFIKYSKDQNGVYKLEISADSILFGSSKKSVETELTEVKTTADGAKSTAEMAQSTANTAKTTADTAKTTANAAQSTANTAKTTANAAQSTADAAKSAAETAQSTANGAQEGVNSLATRVTNAETSITQNSDEIALRAKKTELTEVKTAAETAQSTADDAKTTAAAAQSAANTAKSTADTAKSTAETAQSTADTAKSTANAAKSTAETAKSTADGAQEGVNKLTTRVTDAETIIRQNSKAITLRATSESVSKDITDTNSKIEKLQAQFDVQAKSIASLIRNGETGSLLKQDAENLYFFDISGLKTNLSENANKINEANESISKILTDTEYLKTKTEYIAVGTDENDKPYIELGEGDSDFKVKITNEQIEFKDGASTPAYITNQKLMIENAKVNNELRFGPFVWKKRSNGNLGIIWEEETS